MNPDVQTPKLQVPFKIENGSADVVEQDSIEEIQQCVLSVFFCPVGSRVDEPEFGIPDPAFYQDSGAIDTSLLQDALSEWEPRALGVFHQDDIEDFAKKIHIDLEQQTEN